MNIIEAIKQRRTVKPENFTRKKIDDSLIWKMLEAANFAPTHALTQPWRFKVFSGEGLKNFGHFHAELYQKSVATEQFLKAKYDKLKNRPLLCSHLISLGMKRQETEKLPEIEEIAAVSCAVQNMMLVATSFGIATYWGSGGMTYHPEMKTFLDLGEKDKCLGFIYCGISAEPTKPANRTPIEEKTSFVRQ